MNPKLQTLEQETQNNPTPKLNIYINNIDIVIKLNFEV